MATTGWLYDVLRIGSWGTVTTNSDAAVTLTADEINGGLILLAGRGGAQTVALPASGCDPGASVLILADHASVGSTNSITVDGTVTLTAQDQSAAMLWTGARWVRL